MSRYAEIIAKLYAINVTKGMKLGLENVIRLNRFLGSPSHAYPSVHVAGTNGKGSVVTKVSKGLQGKYRLVGSYISPHISSFRERISINGTMISEEDVARMLPSIIDLAERENISATFFELTTLLAYKYFAENKVEMAVFETGLGGRLDATNILNPALTIITSIDFDHMDLLGNSLESIAREKSGIIKPGVPVILGPSASIVPLPDSAKALFIQGPFEDVEDENRAIAAAALDYFHIPRPTIKKALTAKLPCRRERIIFQDREVILDVAHNPRGLERLFQDLKIKPEDLRIVIGLSKTKDLESCLKIVQSHAWEIHLVDSPNGRCAAPQRLKEILLNLGVDENRVSIDPTISQTMTSAFSKSGLKKQELLVCGTFFIMSESRKFLNVVEPSDPIDLNERFRIS